LHRFLVADIGLEADDLADIPLRHQRQGAFRVANGDADLVSPRPKPLNQMPADKARASENGNQLTRHSSFPLISGSDKDNALLYRHCPDLILILSLSSRLKEQRQELSAKFFQTFDEVS